jgi:hypothetical protein
MKQKCAQFREMFSEYLDEQLTPARCKALEAHLASCEQCRAELRLWRMTVEAVADLPRHRAPQGFMQGVMARIEEPETVRPAARVYVLLRRALPFAAMFLLGFGLSVLVRPQASDESERMALELLCEEYGALSEPGVFRQSARRAAGRARGQAEDGSMIALPTGGEETLAAPDFAPESAQQSQADEPMLEDLRRTPAPNRDRGDIAATDWAAISHKERRIPLGMARAEGPPERGLREGADLKGMYAFGVPSSPVQAPQQVLTMVGSDPMALTNRAMHVAVSHRVGGTLNFTPEGPINMQVAVPIADYERMLAELARLTRPESQMLANTASARGMFFDQAITNFVATQSRLSSELALARVADRLEAAADARARGLAVESVEATRRSRMARSTAPAEAAAAGADREIPAAAGAVMAEIQAQPGEAEDGETEVRKLGDEEKAGKTLPTDDALEVDKPPQAVYLLILIQEPADGDTAE